MLHILTLLQGKPHLIFNTIKLIFITFFFTEENMTIVSLAKVKKKKEPAQLRTPWRFAGLWLLKSPTTPWPHHCPL